MVGLKFGLGLGFELESELELHKGRIAGGLEMGSLDYLKAADGLGLGLLGLR